MPSFDIVSQINLQEVDNAVHQVMKEVATRFDFKGVVARITSDKDGLQLVAGDDFKMKALIDILQNKLVKREVSLKAVSFGSIESSLGGEVKCTAKFVQGIAGDLAKELVRWIKEIKLKVQSQIQGDGIRVSGKKKDDLQTVIAAIRGREWPIPLQFTNFRE